MKKFILITFLILLSSCGDNATTNTINTIENTVVIEDIELSNGDVIAILETTKGDIKILLETVRAPITANNFIGLSEEDFYDWIIFHRVIDWFMIQWWDPTWTGMWWKSIYWKSFNDEFSEELSNLKYTISMANSWVNTNGSQFFINTSNNSNLDFNKQPLTSKHAVFGQVVSWFNVVDSISAVEVDVRAWNKPFKDIVINDVLIKEYQNGDYIDYNFDENAALKNYELKLESDLEKKKNKVLEAWDTVSVHYTLKLSDGSKKDSSYDRWTPFTFTLWRGSVIKWWDEWLLWHKIWDKFNLEVSPENWYWLIEIVVPKSELKQFEQMWLKLEKWELLQTANGNIEILDSNDETVTLNNPSDLAWEVLFFDIEIIEIK